VQSESCRHCFIFRRNAYGRIKSSGAAIARVRNPRRASEGFLRLRPLRSVEVWRGCPTVPVAISERVSTPNRDWKERTSLSTVLIRRRRRRSNHFLPCQCLRIISMSMLGVAECQAAKQLRRRFRIDETDPSGASRVFEWLRLETDRSGSHLANEMNLTGAVSRDGEEAHVALLQPAVTQRRFAAARAVFSAWAAEPQEKRFLTSAVDQQANRAFAAELTAPYALLRARSKNSKLSQDQVFDLAAELQIGTDVVSKQALNNGLQVRAT
jgi:hypothetical protein